LQCSIDCPYGAIEMIERVSRRSDLVARVDSSLCVSCGICAGSCAPMGVGPPGRTGRDQLAEIQSFIAAPGRRAGEVIAICCDHGAGGFAPALAAEGAAIYPVNCAGNLHTSLIEMLLRGGAGGVLVLACPTRDCWNREGPSWLAERVYHQREAELQERVDRRRVRIAHANASERRIALAALRAFAAEVARLDMPVVDHTLEADATCEPVGTAVP
jgi:coenzyme F420-reducing hydrogenase delta subunit